MKGISSSLHSLCTPLSTSSTFHLKGMGGHLTDARSYLNWVLRFPDSSLPLQASYGTDQALTLADDLNENMGAVLGHAIAKDGPITVTGIATSDQIVEVPGLACCFYAPQLCPQSHGSCIRGAYAYAAEERQFSSGWNACSLDWPDRIRIPHWLMKLH